ERWGEGDARQGGDGGRDPGAHAHHAGQRGGRARRTAGLPATARALHLLGDDRCGGRARHAARGARHLRDRLSGDRHELPARSAPVADSGARPSAGWGRLIDLAPGPVPDRSRTPIQLTILRQGDLNIVDLAELGSLIPRSETHVDDDFLRDLASETAHLAVAARGGGETARALERVGGLVFSHLLTEPARAFLTAAEPGDLYLRLDERLVHVPWELCHDG